MYKNQHLIEDFIFEAGWYDGYNPPTDQQVAERAKALIDEIVDYNIKAPYVHPIIDGGLQLEWSLSDNEICVTVDVQVDNTLYIHALDLALLEAEDIVLEEDDADAIIGIMIKMLLKQPSSQELDTEK